MSARLRSGCDAVFRSQQHRRAGPAHSRTGSRYRVSKQQRASHDASRVANQRHCFPLPLSHSLLRARRAVRTATWRMWAGAATQSASMRSAHCAAPLGHRSASALRHSLTPLDWPHVRVRVFVQSNGCGEYAVRTVMTWLKLGGRSAAHLLCTTALPHDGRDRRVASTHEAAMSPRLPPSAATAPMCARTVASTVRTATAARKQWRVR